MTHEELLQKLADIAHNKDAHEARNDYLLALRAVAELHKPTTIVWTDDIKENYCGTCGHTFWIPYPCQTIEAIEKALS